MTPLTFRQVSVVLLVAALSAAVLALPVPPGTGPKVLPALALTVFTVGLWATGSLPEFITAIIFFVLALVFQIAPADVVFSGLKSSAFWLVAGGVVIGVAAGQTGLGRFLAHAFVSRLNKSYLQLTAGIVFGAVVLAFLVPAAIARLIILMPIVLGLADQLGFSKGSRGRTGMVLATTFACFFIPLTILPANLPNVVLAGVADGLYGLKITYGFYLLMQFPVTGALKGLILVTIIHFLFSEPIPVPGKMPGGPPRLRPEGKRLAVIVTATLAVWATDVFHGIQPGWVAVASALVCLMPGVVVVKAADFRKNASFQTLFFAPPSTFKGSAKTPSVGRRNPLNSPAFRIVPAATQASIQHETSPATPLPRTGSMPQARMRSRPSMSLSFPPILNSFSLMNDAAPKSPARSMSSIPKMDSSSIIGTAETSATDLAASQSPAGQGCSKSSIPAGSSSVAKRRASFRS